MGRVEVGTPLSNCVPFLYKTQLLKHNGICIVSRPTTDDGWQFCTSHALNMQRADAD